MVHQDANNGKNNILILGASTFDLMGADNVSYMFANFRGKFVVWDPYKNGSTATEITDVEIDNYLLANENGKVLDFTKFSSWEMRGTLIPTYMFSGIEIRKIIVTDIIISIASFVIMAGKLPVEAITLAPSSPLTHSTNSQAASCLSVLVVTAKPVIVPRVEPASTPSA